MGNKRLKRHTTKTKRRTDKSKKHTTRRLRNIKKTCKKVKLYGKSKNKCKFSVPIGLAFKTCKGVPKGSEYIIQSVNKKEQIYMCIQASSHHSGMYGTPFPCDFVESVIKEPWQSVSVKKMLAKYKYK